MGMNYQKKAIEIMDNVSKVIVGKEDVTKLVLTSLIAGGHVLLEDVPGTGKTMLAQCIPGIMPTLTTFCWQMRLTVQRRVHSRHCLNVWRNIR